MLDRTALTPLWAQVREDLRARLSAGEFANGVPPEVALAMEYGVSRHTMREALSALRAEGVVQSQRGRGTTVVQAVTQPARTVVDPEVARLLALPSDTPLTMEERRQGALGGSPVLIRTWRAADVTGPPT